MTHIIKDDQFYFAEFRDECKTQAQIREWTKALASCLKTMTLNTPLVGWQLATQILEHKPVLSVRQAVILQYDCSPGARIKAKVDIDSILKTFEAHALDAVSVISISIPEDLHALCEELAEIEVENLALFSLPCSSIENCTKHTLS